MLRCQDGCTLMLPPFLPDTYSSFSQVLWHASMGPERALEVE